ncbi:MAG: M50 family metallopeptidase [Ruminococcus flavefaciens]|nr:M50 family metallopeptidase [Ruminococcus flavefaciens]
MSRKFRFSLTILALILVSIIMYIFVHESGHALVAILCGAKNVKISIVSAHTWWTGDSFTAITDALCYVAGAALPVFVSWIAMIFYSKSHKGLIYHIVYFIFLIVSISSVFAWVGIPAYSMFAPFPDQTDDVARFLNASDIPPIIVSLTGVIVILISIFIAIKKQLFSTWIQLAKDIRNFNTNSKSAIFVSNKSLAGVSIAVLFSILITVLFELPSMMAKPILSFDITGEVPEAGTYRTFEIEKEYEYDFHAQLDAEGLLVDICISNEAQELVFRDMIWDRLDSNSTFYLSPGTYTLSLTYLTDVDLCNSYCSTMDYHFEDWEMEKFASIYEQDTKLSSFFVELR